MAEAEQTSAAVERARLVNECNAVIEKRGRRSFSIGPWDLFVWQERFVSATETALVYQVRARGAPRSNAAVVCPRRAVALRSRLASLSSHSTYGRTPSPRASRP